ncbi:TPA: hypothetical protein N0F65_003377 [Lagenidium giganteum]|uniref:U3 small nucleolar ribonucleoprotein protein IMP3 n=1 Tax=Lagenidium giganteum TaxID=4803 RepID=A0AAV2ZB59_9STRA|nr:TPA: hypothetical protein N0F65_003377 [Lagenidium giganteum]
MRQLKFHEQKLLKKVDLLEWRKENNLHEIKVIRRYRIPNREEYHKYNRLVGHIHKVAARLKKRPANDPFRIKTTEALLEKLYNMGLIQTKKSLIKADEVTVSSFCRRRLPVVMVRVKMAETIKEATTFVEQGHIRVGPNVVTDPAFLVTRNMEDFVTWVDSSKIKRTIMNDLLGLDHTQMARAMATMAASLALSMAILTSSTRTAAQSVPTVEIARGSIFRKATYVTVDQYRLELPVAMDVEFDILSAETTDNKTFVDVNGDCDSAFIDSQMRLFKSSNNGKSWDHIASNDDEADDNRADYGRGRGDGSIGSLDSYMRQLLAPGTYMLAVGRYPLSINAATAGKATDSLRDYSPYTCQVRMAPYGNDQLTIRSTSTTNQKVLKTTANSYVGNSCSPSPAAITSSRQCVYKLPGNFQNLILASCPYDKTVS